MKKNILIICTVVIASIYGVFVGKKEIFPYELFRYISKTIVPASVYLNQKPHGFETRTSLYKIYKNNPTAKIVMIGDSITDGCNWNELLKRGDVINRAIPGDTTYGILTRLDTINPGSIEKAFLMVGINDIFKHSSVKDIFQRYVDIISYLEKNKIHPVIQSTLYVGEKRNHHKELNIKVSKLNTLLKKISYEHNIEYIDLNSQLSKNKLLLEVYTGDGVHLNADGYVIWKNILMKHL